MSLVKKIGIGALALAVLLLAWVGFLSVTRGTPVRTVIAIGDGGGPPPVSDTLFARTMELFVNAHVEPGNRVEIMTNGDETYPRLWADLRSATRTITAQFYYCQPGAVADTFAAIVAERARAGVRVLVVLDAFGSQNLLDDRRWVRRLEEAGVELARLRPLHWYSLHKANFRSHVRTVVVDGRVGYTGGFGLADYWLGDGRSVDEWRETNVRVMGPAVTQLQAIFASA
jgi:cardiolipin synthase